MKEEKKIITALITIVLTAIFTNLAYSLINSRKKSPKREKFVEGLANQENNDMVEAIKQTEDSLSEGKCKKDDKTKRISNEIVKRLKDDLTSVSEKLDNSLEIRKIIENLEWKSLLCCNLEESLTEDKKKVFICTKSKDGKYYNYNKLFQVALHELAHAISKGVDPSHSSPEFNENYSLLMKKAVEMRFIDQSQLHDRK